MTYLIYGNYLLDKPPAGGVSCRVIIPLVVGYFDGSGDLGRAEPNTIVLAGYAASEEFWKKFSDHWMDVLLRHARFCETWKEPEEALHWHTAKAFHAAYSSNDPSLMKEFGLVCAELVTLLHNLDTEHDDLYAYSTIVRMSDYRRYQETHQSIKEPEALCTEACVGQLIGERGERGKSIRSIEVVFDPNEPFLNMIHHLWAGPRETRPWWRNCIKAIREEDKDSALPLQASDLLAWMTNRHFVAGDVSAYMWPFWMFNSMLHVDFNYERLVHDFGK